MRRFISAIAAFVLILSCCTILRAQTSPPAAPRSALVALALRLPEVKFEGTRFADAIDYLREVSGANFAVDWKSLETVGVTRDTPVSFSARKITLRKALNLMLSQTANPGDLAFYNDGGVIEITTKAIADDVLITRVYDVEDLLILPMSMNNNNNGGTTGGNSINSGYSSGSSRSGTNSRSGYSGSSRGSRGQSGSSGMTSSRSGGGSLFGGGGSTSGGRSSSYAGTSGTSGNGYGNTDTQALADELVTMIMDTIEPNIWRENGGTSTIRYFRGNLIVTAPRRIHERIGGAFE